MFKTNYISQLINGIPKFLQKLRKCFNGKTILTLSNTWLSFSVFPVMLVLYLKDSESGERGLLGSSL